MSEHGTAYGGSVTQDQLTSAMETNGGIAFRSGAFDVVGGTTTLIGTTGTGKGRFRIMHRAVICKTVEGYATPAAITIGTNAPDYDNIFSWTLTSQDVVEEYLQGTSTGIITIPEGTAIYGKLATPAGADAMTVQLILEGAYDPPLA
jgi:hypothetical protein